MTGYRRFMLARALSLQHQVAGDAATVTVNLLDLRAAVESLSESVQGAIGEQFRIGAAAPLKEFRQPRTEGFILGGGTIAVGR